MGHVANGETIESAAATEAAPSNLINQPCAKYAESTAGINLKITPDLGRVLVATRSFDVGERVFREEPVLVWTPDDDEEFISHFHSLSEDDRRMILAMHHAPLDHPSVENLKSKARDVAYFSGMEYVTVLKLRAIHVANAHQYFGHNEQKFEETVVERPPPRTALFLLGSVVAHSCEPNCAYSSKTEDGKLEYKVIRKIDVGDIITFSYIGDLFSTNTAQRRRHLQVTKAFFCRCKRCMRADDCRVVICERCHQKVQCKYDASETAKWACSSCSDGAEVDFAADPLIERVEARLANSIISMETRLGMGIGHLGMGEMQAAEALVKDCYHYLSPVHGLTSKAREAYIKICASKAAEAEMIAWGPEMGPLFARFAPACGTASSLRLRAGVMGLKMVLACECQVAGCTGLTCSPQLVAKHEPVYEMAQPAFHAFQDLIKATPDIKKWKPAHIVILRRYIPSLRLLWGEHDSDVQDMAQTLNAEGAGTLSNAEAVAAEEAVQEPFGPKVNWKPNASKSNKKKQKGRGTNNKKKKGKRWR